MIDLLTQHAYILPAMLALGLFAGVMGGMLGVGGSVIMIPGMVLLFGHGRIDGFNQHAYQAAAMIANVAVALPAARRHYQAGAVNADVLRIMLPAALIAVILGVWLSNRSFFLGPERGIWLGRILAIFLLYEAGYNLLKVIRNRPPRTMANARITSLRAATAGSGMGIVGGLLGVGGGVLAIPLQQWLLALPLRNAIANSAVVMVASATIGACYKNATLTQHAVPWYGGLAIAALLVPTCILGARLGANLTHRLPNRQIRIAYIIIITLAALRLFHLPIPGISS